MTALEERIDDAKELTRRAVSEFTPSDGTREALESLSMWVTTERQKYRVAGGMPAGGFDNMTPIEVALAKVEVEISRRTAPAVGRAAPTDPTRRDAIAQALLDRFIERGSVRMGGSTFPPGTKVQTLVRSYQDDFYADADAILALSSTQLG